MKPTIAIFDDFFPDPERARQAIVSGQFVDVKNPIDGVVYPGINHQLPGWVEFFVLRRLSVVLNGPVTSKAMFARLTSSVTGPAPHQIHSDTIMGQYSAHVYLSREWPEGAGTSFWSHESEGFMHTEETDIAKISVDMHRREPWRNDLRCQGLFNRILIHDARYWHCAEPVGGWGSTPEDGRLVLTCFFDAEKGETW